MKRLFILVLLVLVPAGVSARPRPNLIVTASSGWAQVFIGDKSERFVTPFETTLKPGRYQLSASTWVYMPIHSEITIKPGQVVKFFVKFNAKPDDDPPEPPTGMPAECIRHFTKEYVINGNRKTNCYEIIPNIPFHAGESARDVFKNKWPFYNRFGQEALHWLEAHGVKTQSAKIEWWGRKYWPKGAKPPELVDVIVM